MFTVVAIVCGTPATTLRAVPSGLNSTIAVVTVVLSDR